VGTSRKRLGSRVVAAVAALLGLLALGSPAAAARQLAPSSTTLAISPNPAPVGVAVTLTATVTCTGFPPTGNVTFFDGPDLLTTVEVDNMGHATFITPFATAGGHQITASYSGNPNCAASFDVGTLTVVATSTTITVSTNPTQPVLGQPTTIAAVVTCVGDGDPTGSVTFTNSIEGTLGTAAPGTAGPGTDQRTFTVTHTFTTPGSHTITAAFTSTNPSCVPIGPATTTVAVVACTTVNGDHFGPLTVTTPTCLNAGTRIFGDVTISGSGSLTAQHAEVFGSLTARGGTGLQLCGSTVHGSTAASGMGTSPANPATIMIGGGGDEPCAGNVLGGPVNLTGNVGPLELGGNTIQDSVTVTNNTAPGSPLPPVEQSIEIEANTISGNLACSGNVPPPTNDGRPNTVHGLTSGQCTGL
jgi:hypothetical protein